MGGSDFEQARDMAIDKDGNIYIAGGTSSPDFPVTNGAVQTIYNNSGSATIGNWGPMMAFVAKFSSSGQLLWSTFLGGPSYDRCYAVEVDEDGYVYVGGRAGEGYPTTPGAAQEQFFNGNNAGKNALYGHQNGFITKLSPDGDKIIWSTYYGADSRGFFRDIAIDDEGYVYGILNAVLGKPMGIDSDSFDDTHNGGHDMVAVKFSQDGSEVLWASFIGGSDDDTGGPSIKVGPDKSVYVCGGTESDDLPTTPNAVQSTYGGNGDMYVARFSPDGSDLIYCTYFGGSGTEATETHGLFVDHLGQAYVACGSSSIDARTTPNAVKPNTNNRDCLLFKLSLDGTELLASTYFGGSEGDHPEGLFVDKDQNLYFGGETVSLDMPITTNAPFPTFLGNTDAYVAKLNPDFSKVEFCSYYGGSDKEAVRAFYVSNTGDICISGQSHSQDLQTSSNAFQKNHIAPKNKANVFLSIFSLDTQGSIETKYLYETSVFPNPSEEIIEFNLKGYKDITVYDSQGKIVIQNQTSEDFLNISELSKGIYYLDIVHNDELYKSSFAKSE
ncbi:MAG: S-layer protein [Candidatus Kapaibacteriales bacterium]